MNELRQTINRVAALLCISFSAANASAVLDKWWYAGVAGSVLWPSISNHVTVNNGSSCATPINQDAYTINTGSSGAVSVNVGRKWQKDSNFIPGYALGLRYQHFFLSTVNGTITQYSLPQFLNYDYQLSTSADLISLYSKIDLIRANTITPFVEVGVGLAVNHTDNYSETARSGVTSRVSPGFNGFYGHNFAYNVGVGVEYAFIPQCSISLTYDYQYLGAMRTASGVSTWSSEQLNLGNYKANMLTLGLTYYFDRAETRY